MRNFIGIISILFLLSSCFSYEYSLEPNKNYIPDYQNHEKFVVNNEHVNFAKYHLSWIDPGSLMLWKPQSGENEDEEDAVENENSVMLINLEQKELKEIPENQQKTLKNTYEETYYYEKIKKGAGKVAGEVLLNTLFGGEAGMETPFKGYIHSKNGMGKYKINVKGNYISYEETPDQLKLNFSSDKLGYNASYSFNSEDDDIPGGSPLTMAGINARSYLSSMQASPTGRYVKLSNYLLDLKEGTREKLHEQDATSVLSPDWSEIVFTRAKIIEEGGLFADHVDEHTIIIEKTKFNPQKY
jgi:hypothetical protein